MITFIIPTIGRNTLINSIKSIENQTNSEWKIIIIFDGIKSTIDATTRLNPKITIFESSKMGINNNSAGNVRNYGIAYADTEWIAFLDDDDIIASDYIETFNKELIEYPLTDILIFRMTYENNINYILPILNTESFYVNNVGISFALKTKIFDIDNIKFIPSSNEDYSLLNELRDKKYIIMISPHIKYLVRGNTDIAHHPTIQNTLGNRIIINNIENIENIENKNT